MSPSTKRAAMASKNDYRKPRNKELLELTWNLPYALRIKDPKGRVLWQNRIAEELETEPGWSEHPVSWQNKKAVLELPTDQSSVEAKERISDLEAEVARLKKQQRQTARKKRQAEEAARKKSKSAGSAEKREKKLADEVEKLRRENENLRAENKASAPSPGEAKEQKRLQKTIRELESKLQSKEKDVARFIEEAEAQAQEIDRLQDESRTRYQEVEQYQSQAQALEQRNEELKKSLDERGSDSDDSESSETLARLLDDKKALESWVEELEEKLESEKTKSASVETELVKLERRCHDLESGTSEQAQQVVDELEALKQEKTEFQQRLAAQEQELDDLRNSVTKSETGTSKEAASSEELQAEVDGLKSSLTAAERRENRLNEKLKTLEELRSEHSDVLTMLRDDLKESREREKELKERLNVYSEMRLKFENAVSASKELEEKLAVLEASESKLKDELSKVKDVGAMLKSAEGGASLAEADTLTLSVKTQIKFLEKRLSDTEKKLDAANLQVQQEKAQNSAAKEAEKLAYQDPLTTLPNRNMIDRYLSYAHQQSQTTRRALCLFVIDIDGFRYLNGTFGRDWADELLKAVGQRLNGMRGASHLVARKSQDQFILLAADIEQKAAPGFIREAARSLLEALAYPFEVSGQEVKLTGSIGASLGPLEGDSSIGLYDQALVALEQAKIKGVSQFAMYDDSVRQKDQKASVYAKQMEHALAKDEFKAVFQPIFHLSKGIVMGLELLLRWEHRDQRELKPGEFLDSAIKSGLIFKMTERIWPKAFANFARWQRMRPGLTLSINLCDKELLSPSLLKRTVHWVQEAQVNPASIIFEVRDQSRLRRSPSWWPILQDYHGAGFGLCLDDFASDASYFGTLAYQGFRQAKIRITDEKALHFVSTPQAGKNVQYCAKFLQNKFDKKALAKAGFHLAQGYAVSRPLDYDGVDMVLS